MLDSSLANILIIDDEPHDIHLLMEALDPRWRTLVASSGEAGLRLARQHQPDLILLDVVLPDLGGFEVCRRLKADTDTCQIPVIFVTALTDCTDEAEGLRIGGVDYVRKPFNLPVVSLRIAKQLANPPSAGAGVLVQTLGDFRIGWPNRPPIKWRTQKTRQLAAYLVHQQGLRQSCEAIAEQLWPEVEAPSGTKLVYNGVYYLRKALEESGIPPRLLRIDSDYRLVLAQEAIVDAIRFSRGVKGLAPTDLHTQLESLEALYNGEYFAGAPWVWCYGRRAMLEQLYVTLVDTLLDRYLHQSDRTGAERLLKRALDLCPHNEALTLRCVALYLDTGRHVEALRQLRQLETSLRQDLQMRPGERVRELLRQLTG